MLNISYKKTGLIFGTIAFFEILSFLGYFYEPLKIIGVILVSAIALWLTLKNLENGLLILFAELIIGSKGHLFEVGPVSIRMIIFAIIMLAYLIKLFNRDNRQRIVNQLKEFKATRYLLILAFFVLIGLASAFFYHNTFNNILADFNAWVFFLLFFPILSVYYQAEDKIYNNLKTVALAAFIWLGLETFIILYIFTHNLEVISDLYLWLRKTGVAEITPTLGSWPRIFIQSQIYAAIALVIAPFLKHKHWWLAILAWSVCLISMSRSFWLGVVLVLVIGLLGQVIFFGWKKVWSKIFFIIGSSLASILLILLIAYFPIPKPGSFSADSLIKRASLDSGEAAVASRWSLLPVMWQEITKSPIFGFGYGKTITYKSSDPRVLQNNPNGEYTTYAFEWGYLSLWLKLGLLGLLSYLTLIATSVYQGFKKWRKNTVLAGVLSLGILILAVVNFFTPYLDHPLGIGFLLLAIVLIQDNNKTCQKSENEVY